MIESVEATAKAASYAAIEEKSSSVRASSGDLVFDGTPADLQRKHPEMYDKFIMQGFALHIVHECQHMHDHYMEVVKRSKQSG